MAKYRKSARRIIEEYGSDAYSIGQGMADTYPEADVSFWTTNRGGKIPKYTPDSRKQFSWVKLPKKLFSDFIEGFKNWRQ